MALTDKWSKAKLRAVVRRELLDPQLKWWDDDELDRYITEWQNKLQEEVEFVWGSATYTTSLATATLTAIATDILRLDAIYWNNRRLVGRSKEELDMLSRNWRNADSGTPYVCYQDNDATVSFWPPPDVAGTVVLEYPVTLAFAVDTSTMQVPAWTRYSVKNYALWRAYSRFGPNQDQNIAARRRAKFEKQLRKFKTMMANFFPHQFPSLRPGGEYEKDILQPEPPDKIDYNL